MSDFTMTIAARAMATKNTFQVRNPATEEVLAQAPDCSRADLDLAMDAAARAFPTWRIDESARRAALKQAADVVGAAAMELAPVLTAEQGKPLNDAMIEVFACSMWLSYYADLEVPAEIIQDDHAARVEVLRRPLGVVAAITPWNFPLVLACTKIAPALRAGNTIVLKPSPFTPLSTLKFGTLLAEVLPPGVFNVVSGGDALGEWMTSHPVPRKISFTGSVATGKRVAAAAAPDLKRVTLELGGNDPAIILDDADPDTIADALFWSAFANNGQICSAVKRVYVPVPLYDRLVDALAQRARTTKVGNGAADDTRLGPINNRPQYERVLELVADAVGHGGRPVAGGKAIEGPGYFFEPTIITNVDDGMRIVDEEQFGPVLPIVPYRDVEDAVRRANATHFGLSGSVWSADRERAAEVAAQLDCGTAWVNTHLAGGPHQPFGGVKWSGLGVENGTWGLFSFTELQVLHRAKC